MFTVMEWVGSAFVVLVAIMIIAISVVLFFVIRTMRGRAQLSETAAGFSGVVPFAQSSLSAQSNTPPFAESQWPLVPGQVTSDLVAAAPHHPEAHHHAVPAAETAHHHAVEHHHSQPVPETHHPVESVHHSSIEPAHHTPPPMPDIPAPTFTDTGMHHGGHGG